MAKQPVRVPLGRKVRLKDYDAAYTGGIKNKRAATKELAENIAVLADLGYRLYAEIIAPFCSYCRGWTPPARTGRSATSCGDSIRKVARSRRSSSPARRVGPRFSLADQSGGPPPRRHRHFQPLAL